ncbi:hypothetical protein ScPMuIL_013662 [Solemya velum]
MKRKLSRKVKEIPKEDLEDNRTMAALQLGHVEHDHERRRKTRQRSTICTNAEGELDNPEDEDEARVMTLRNPKPSYDSRRRNKIEADTQVFNLEPKKDSEMLSQLKDDILFSQVESLQDGQVDVGWDCNSPSAVRNLKKFSKTTGSDITDIVMKLGIQLDPDELPSCTPPLLGMWFGVNNSTLHVPPGNIHRKKKRGRARVQDSLMSKEFCEKLTFAMKSVKDSEGEGEDKMNGSAEIQHNSTYIHNVPDCSRDLFEISVLPNNSSTPVVMKTKGRPNTSGNGHCMERSEAFPMSLSSPVKMKTKGRPCTPGNMSLSSPVGMKIKSRPCTPGNMSLSSPVGMKTKSRPCTPGNMSLSSPAGMKTNSRLCTPGNMNWVERSEALEESWSDDDFFQDNSFILKATQCSSDVMSPLATGCKRRTSFEITTQPDPKTSKYSPQARNIREPAHCAEIDVKNKKEHRFSSFEPVAIPTTSVWSNNVKMSPTVFSSFTKPSSATVIRTDICSSSNTVVSSCGRSPGFHSQKTKPLSNQLLSSSSSSYSKDSSKVHFSNNRTVTVTNVPPVLNTSSFPVAFSGVGKSSAFITSNCIQPRAVVSIPKKSGSGKPPVGRPTNQNSWVTSNQNASNCLTKANPNSFNCRVATNPNSCRSVTASTQKVLSPMDVSVLPTSQSQSNSRFRFKKYNSFDSLDNKSKENVLKMPSSNCDDKCVIRKTSTGMRRTNSFDGVSYSTKAQTDHSNSVSSVQRENSDRFPSSLHLQTLTSTSSSTMEKTKPTKPLPLHSNCKSEFPNTVVPDTKSNVFDTSLPDELLINLSEPDDLLDSQEILDIHMPATTDFLGKDSLSSEKKWNKSGFTAAETSGGAGCGGAVFGDAVIQSKKNSICDQSKCFQNSNSFNDRNVDKDNGNSSEKSCISGPNFVNEPIARKNPACPPSFKSHGVRNSVSRAVTCAPLVINGALLKTNCVQEQSVCARPDLLQLQALENGSEDLFLNDEEDLSEPQILQLLDSMESQAAELLITQNQSSPEEILNTQNRCSSEEIRRKKEAALQRRAKFVV